MPPEINILGYSGSHMSLIIESLTKLKFQGKVRVVMHDDTKYFDAPFETGLDVAIVKQAELDNMPSGEFFFCSNNPSNKLFLFSFFKKKWGVCESQYTSIIHPTAVMATSVTAGRGLYVEPLSVISPYAKIGFGVSINRLCSIGHHNILHDYCSIYPGSHLTGDVKIGRAATIGPGTVVFSGVEIGENSIIGGGSVVTKNIPPNVLAWGNPCKPVKSVTLNKNQKTIV